MSASHQFSLTYILSEVALIALALAAGRMMLIPSALWLEFQALCFCVAMTAACGALGGLCLRMAVGLIGGGILSVASIPLLWMVISG